MVTNKVKNNENRVIWGRPKKMERLQKGKKGVTKMWDLVIWGQGGIR